MIRRSVSLFALTLILAATILGGCAGSASIKTIKSSEYTDRLKKVLVVHPLKERMGPEYAGVFEKRLVEEFAKRQIDVNFAIVPGRLDLDEVPSFEKQAVSYGASSLFIMRSAGGLRTEYGHLIRADFDASIFDLASKKRVWRADIRYQVGGTAVPVAERVEVLLGEILKGLASDGMI